MINLDNINVKKFEANYLGFMKSRVIDKVSSMSQVSINEFTDQSIHYFLNNNGVDLDQFIEDLLVENISDLCIKYMEFQNYFLTCKFVFYSNFSVQKELAKIRQDNTSSNMQNFRKDFVNKYTNPWIMNIITDHTEYFNSNSNFKRLVNEVREKLNSLNDEIGNIFNYDLINSSERHRILYEFGIEVCPYCNRNFVSKFKKNGELKTTADLDHFYPKKYFTLLSLSLHNFVPSCQICNSRFKLAKGIEIINPYIEKIDYNEFKFKHDLNLDSDISIFFNESDSFDVKLECTNSRYSNNIELFELENLYNTHKSLVAEIVYKKKAYNSSYRHLFDNLFEELSLSKDEIDYFLYGIEMNEDAFFKKPLSKLIYDIVKGS